MRSGKGLPRRGLPGARERVRSESYPEYEQSHISSTRDCVMVLKLERFSHQSDIYIYICVCVCVCVWIWPNSSNSILSNAV